MHLFVVIIDNKCQIHLPQGYGTGIRVLMLNVLATTDNYMSVDCKAFKTAVRFGWHKKKNQLLFLAT